MAREPVTETIGEQEWLEPVGHVLDEAVTHALARSNPVQRGLSNFLHGTWLGHPLHPAITDVPVGAWTAATVMDIAGMASDNQAMDAGADAAIAVGLVGAAGAAATGLNDWQHTRQHARRLGVAHGLLNVAATLLYGTSLAMRRNGRRGMGRAVGLLGYAVSGFSAYLGGHLVFEHRIGVDHTAVYRFPRHFVPVMDEDDLREGEHVRVEAEGVPVLLARRNGEVQAICETCTHMGGPLEDGTFADGTVTCPWHGSRFALDDGRVLDGPATFPERCFETRVQDGRIEVKAAG